MEDIQQFKIKTWSDSIDQVFLLDLEESEAIVLKGFTPHQVIFSALNL